MSIGIFKRGVQRYGRTPEPTTPYQRAGQLWDERIGSARVQARNWRLMAFGGLAMSSAMADGLIWQSLQSRVTPYVVEVDRLGEARAVTEAEAGYRPTDPQIAWHLAKFVETIRSVSLAPVLMRRDWLAAYDFTTRRGAQMLGEYARSANPFAGIGDRTVSVQVTSVVRASDRSFQGRGHRLADGTGLGWHRRDRLGRVATGLVSHCRPERRSQRPRQGLDRYVERAPDQLWRCPEARAAAARRSWPSDPRPSARSRDRNGHAHERRPTGRSGCNRGTRCAARRGEGRATIRIDGQGRHHGKRSEQCSGAVLAPTVSDAGKPMLDPDRDPSAQVRKLDFVATSDRGNPTNPHALTAAASPNTSSAGSVIAASLITGLRSDLPGLVTAQVTERVHDSATGRILLIPQGARLIGSYDSVVAFGQRRALVVWQRIILPDGSSLALDNVRRRTRRVLRDSPTRSISTPGRC